jgi:archaeosine synthase beta-subunit
MFSRGNSMKKETPQEQIFSGPEGTGKNYFFNDDHDETKPAQFWFQESEEGLVLFIVFYSLACQWSKCLGCNLPSMMSSRHIPYKSIMAQIDDIFQNPGVLNQCNTIKKVIVSNNGSILDQETFSSTALMYLLAKINLHLPVLEHLCIETRAEYVETSELEFIARALSEGECPTKLEIAIGFEAFDDHIRNDIFNKGLTKEEFLEFVRIMAPYNYNIKCYFMQKPVPGMTDEAAVKDIQDAIDFLSNTAKKYGIIINMHLNPTYAARGTVLEKAFIKGEYEPPNLIDVTKATLHGKGKSISIFIGLYDEGLACEGGSFIREGENYIVEMLEDFNQTQDYGILEQICSDSL